MLRNLTLAALGLRVSAGISGCDAGLITTVSDELIRAKNRIKEDFMTIIDWPLAERPREKLLSKGAIALSDAEDTQTYLLHLLGHEHREVFWCLFLDNQHRVIASEALFYGTIDQANV
ncbi:MAG: JAB domain-containing protein, partial [Pseudomonadales bacterium]|nr:JAB domain-containing protein [Pseudomonadales bacterium]